MLKRTTLYNRHVEHGARMAPFGGYEMPIQYQGIIQEHMATRNAVTLFDTCHMGEFRLNGATALADLETLVTCEVGSLEPGRCRYGLLCNETGGVLDDLLVYRLAEDVFMLVVNGATQEKDFAWIDGHRSPGTAIQNVSEQTAKIDIQGPHSARVVRQLVRDDPTGLRFYRFMTNTYRDQPVLLSRTGYTGELGFEVYLDRSLAASLWNDCLERGAVPAGLGARDTLRLEMGMPLYGHELAEDRNAADSGLRRALKLDKRFIGRDAVAGAESSQVLVGITLEGRRAAREGDRLLAESGEAVGAITSGSFAPSLGNAVALGYMGRGHAAAGTRIQVKTARQILPGVVCGLPFHTEGTARRPMQEFLD